MVMPGTPGPYSDFTGTGRQLGNRSTVNLGPVQPERNRGAHISDFNSVGSPTV